MAENKEIKKLEEAERLDGMNRREFLGFLAAGFATLATAGCKWRPPKERIIPMTEAPEETLPGVARWYASTCAGCSASCGALVKVRDGRPIKLEGNPEHPVSRGGLCARGQATILDLYDSERLRRPMISGGPAAWARVDSEIRAGLDRAAGSGGGLRLLSATLTSPSEAAAAEIFLKRHPGARHVVYDPLSSSAILEAHRRTHGRRALPHYHFDRARVIVSFDADFLGAWISPVEFTRDWSSNRNPDRADSEWDLMSWHAQFEPRLSITGANADLRIPIKPSEEFAAVLALARRVASRVGWLGSARASHGPEPIDGGILDQTADLLARAGRRSLVVSGSSDVAVQTAVNWINAMLGNYGATLDLERPSRQRQGDDDAMDGLLEELKRGEVAALVVYGANPAYDHPRAEEFAAAMGKAPLTVALCERMDETASLARYVCPPSHPFESWGDAAPNWEVRSLRQPVLSPLFDTRPGMESLLQWGGRPSTAYDFVRTIWRRDVFPLQREHGSFRAFWDAAVRRGVVAVQAKPLPATRFASGSLENLRSARRPAESGRFELAAYAGVALADGRQANNPWLQELPDPVTRACWGNVASFSPRDAERLGIVEGRVVRLTAGGRTLELPAHVQPGLPTGVIAAALGYGRRKAGKVAANYPMVKLFPVERELLAGTDLYPFLRLGSVAVEVTGRTSPLAKVQIYDSQTDPILGRTRPIVQEAELQDYVRNPGTGSVEEREGSGLWPKHDYKGHKWAMAVDLNACSGCAACVVACQAENNVPVVGKAEVRKNRDMAWLRIDRYYTGAPERSGTDPDVAFQPMLCQHCDNAPCETVCPVLATTHSTEGLNMQVYNRCVGTRYCANNCPYKVRRFNWFDYAHQDLVENLVLNPDVTVRTRGVMEKCSFCVQRIYTAKFDAKSEDREIADGDVRPACMQSCPAQAIVFGDINDPNSRIAKLTKGPRNYRVLAELGTGPSVFYLKKVRNKKVIGSI